jgi:MYXO-CTERM domain-containing protein
VGHPVPRVELVRGQTAEGAPLVGLRDGVHHICRRRRCCLGGSEVRSCSCSGGGNKGGGVGVGLPAAAARLPRWRRQRKWWMENNGGRRAGGASYYIGLSPWEATAPGAWAEKYGELLPKCVWRWRRYMCVSYIIRMIHDLVH